MATMAVIRRDEDRDFAQEYLVPALPALGFDRALVLADSATPSPALAGCTAAVVVMGEDPDAVAPVVAALLRSRTVLLVVDRAAPRRSARRDLGGVPTVDVRTVTGPAELWRRLPWLLPTPDGTLAEPLPTRVGEPLRWVESAFSEILDESALRNDFALAAALVERLGRHLRTRPTPYPDRAAETDLDILRRRRHFTLMSRYATAVIGSGSTSPTVRRQQAQALVELKDFDAALAVLLPLTRDTTPGGHENYEARGLLGRTHKQRYVDAGPHARPEWLTEAIAVYASAFTEDRDRNLWHGVNAASCRLRAARDGVAPPPTDPPARIAESILETLREREARGGRLEVWDAATRVEAYLDLDRYPEALEALDAFVVHPDIRPFQATSMYRQLDEVLQVGRNEIGRALLGRLLELMTRLRAGARSGTTDAASERFLVRVSHPDWEPGAIPDLVIGSRLGTVVSATGSQQTIRALLTDPLVVSIEPSRSMDKPDAVVGPLSFVRVREEYRWSTGPFTEHGAGALIAVVDNGIDVLHETFRDNLGAPRIVGVWDQADASAPPAGVPYGRFHGAEDIARYVRDGVAPARLAGTGGHGTHVASIAAGRPCRGFGGGVAPAARLLVVITGSHEATGYSDAHIDALTFIGETADRLGLPVVVNVSQGMNAGAHDGRSTLEIGFNEFCGGGRRPGRVVVKSAGNERDRGGHATITVPPGGADDLHWRCPPGPPREVRLELWWSAGNDYRFCLVSPAGDRSEWVDRDHPTVEDYFPGQGGYDIKLVPSHVDNGDRLLSIRTTCGVARGPDERWTLAVEASAVRYPGDIQAWIERDGEEPARFLVHTAEEMTLSVPGTADAVIAVGAVGGSTPVRSGTFSSFGPTRDGREKPDLCAPGVDVSGAQHGSVDGAVVMSGTSMAAPHVTGAVALVLSRASACGAPIPTASQTRQILIHNTMFENAYWDRGQGFGVLDVRAVLEDGLRALI